MTWEQIIGFALALLFMLVGLAGCVLPGIPGTPLVLLTAIGHRLYFGDASVGNWSLAFLAGLAALAMGLDYLAGLLGAKKMGATWRGVVGAALGAVVGIFLGPLGILAGPFVGATLLELVGGRRFQESARAGAGAVVGMLLGAVGKVACCVAMIALFAVSVLWNTPAPVP
ncbi:MAG: DUF456 domain-containing protein [Verrucomicrobia bacterium]|nr:DUF456 domain-containing protein [Verrucomicrobiota bacterium]